MIAPNDNPEPTPKVPCDLPTEFAFMSERTLDALQTHLDVIGFHGGQSGRYEGCYTRTDDSLPDNEIRIKDKHNNILRIINIGRKVT